MSGIAQPPARRRRVRAPAVERRGKLWGYGVATLAALAGMKTDSVRAAIRRGVFNPGDIRSVMAWLDLHVKQDLPGKGWQPCPPGLSDKVIAALIASSPRLVRQAREQGHFDPDDGLSTAAWIYERRRWGKPVPSRQFERYMLVALPATPTASSGRDKSGRVRSLRRLRVNLQAIGFDAEIRGTAHVYVKPDFLPIVAAERLVSAMNAAGLSAKDVTLRQRRRLALGKSVALRGTRISAAGRA